jgi:hypothetical protein
VRLFLVPGARPARDCPLGPAVSYQNAFLHTGQI